LSPSSCKDERSKLERFSVWWITSSSKSGSATMGSATIGSDTMGSATIGSDTMGSATIGSDTMGSATIGSDTMGSATIGSATTEAANGCSVASPTPSEDCATDYDNKVSWIKFELKESPGSK